MQRLLKQVKPYALLSASGEGPENKQRRNLEKGCYAVPTEINTSRL